LNHKERANYNFGEFIHQEDSPERSRRAQDERLQCFKCQSYFMRVTKDRSHWKTRYL